METAMSALKNSVVNNSKEFEFFLWKLLLALRNMPNLPEKCTQSLSKFQNIT
jgi:hypothetical protein